MTGQRRAGAKPTTGDLFAHFGLPEVSVPPPSTDTAIARRASPCRRCSWLLTSTSCPVCGAPKDAPSVVSGEPRES